MRTDGAKYRRFWLFNILVIMLLALASCNLLFPQTSRTSETGTGEASLQATLRSSPALSATEVPSASASTTRPTTTPVPTEPVPEPEPAATARPIETTALQVPPVSTEGAMGYDPDGNPHRYPVPQIDLEVGRQPYGYPQKAEDMFADTVITPEVRQEIVRNALALQDLPYLYAPKIGTTYWAPDATYTARYENLYLARQSGPPYAYGTDCTSFLKAVFDYTLGSNFSDYTVSIVAFYREYPAYERDINDPSSWEPGDVVMFYDPDDDRVVHASIYLGDLQVVNSVGQFIRTNRIDEWDFRPNGDLQAWYVFQPPGRLPD